MKQKLLCASVLAAASLLVSAGELSEQQKTQAAPRYSREQLDRIRQSLLSQIAVRDEAEQSVRTATAEEAAALSTPQATAAPREVSFAGGGAAIKLTASELAFAVAEVGKDGKMEMKHAPATTKGTANAR